MFCRVHSDIVFMLTDDICCPAFSCVDFSRELQRKSLCIWVTLSLKSWKFDDVDHVSLVDKVDLKFKIEANFTQIEF